MTRDLRRDLRRARDRTAEPAAGHLDTSEENVVSIDFGGPAPRPATYVYGSRPDDDDLGGGRR